MLGRSADDERVDWEDTNPDDTEIVTYVFAIFSCVCCFTSIYMHFSDWRNPTLQALYIRLLLLPPIYAVTAVIVVFVPARGGFSEVVRGAYESYCIYCFYVLIMIYAGGQRHLEQKLDAKASLHHVGRMCRLFCPPWMSNSFFFGFAKVAVIQFMIVKPIDELISAYLNNEASNDRAENGILILRLISLASMIFAFYMVLNVFSVIKEELQDLGGVLKFVAIKGVVFVVIIQAVICSILVKRGVIEDLDGASADHRSERIQSVLVSLEMFPFTLFFIYCFSHNDAALKKSPTLDESFWKKLRKCLHFYEHIFSSLEPDASVSPNAAEMEPVTA